MSSHAVVKGEDGISRKSQYVEVDHISTNAIDNLNVPVVSHKTDYLVVGVLFVINLLNYIDRFTIPGVMPQIKNFFPDMTDAKAGILQTSFVVTYMIFSPIFGYLGDRMNRKWIITSGITFWSLITLSSSFVPKDKYWLFIVMRSLVGIGEASYSTIAPTIIADLFVRDHRTKVMAFFYFAVPIGSGLGFIIGQGFSKVFDTWQAALWFTPLVGGICVGLMIIFVKEPIRGSAEGGTHLAASPWREDIAQLTKNRSFMLIAFGFTAGCFVIGSVSWFAVTYMTYAAQAKIQSRDLPDDNIQYIFGAMTVLAGFAGVLFGTETGRRLRKYFPNADTLVCGVGFILAAPFFLVSLVLAKDHTSWSYFTIFITQTLLCLNWALVTDMTMGVVIPSRRATANAYQMILSHAFGDAGSPYIIGAIKDSIQARLVILHIDPYNADYYSMQYALLLDTIVAVIGGLFFVLCSFYIVRDKLNVAKVIEESQFHYETVGSSYQPEDSQIISISSTPDVPNMPCII